VPTIQKIRCPRLPPGQRIFRPPQGIAATDPKAPSDHRQPLPSPLNSHPAGGRGLPSIRRQWGMQPHAVLTFLYIIMAGEVVRAQRKASRPARAAQAAPVSYRRSPVTTMSTLRLRHPEFTPAVCWRLLFAAAQSASGGNEPASRAPRCCATSDSSQRPAPGRW
jgi:hypothetical protein